MNFMILKQLVKKQTNPISFKSSEDEMKTILNEIAINADLDYVFVSVFENIAPKRKSNA